MKKSGILFATVFMLFTLNSISGETVKELIGQKVKTPFTVGNYKVVQDTGYQDSNKTDLYRFGIFENTDNKKLCFILFKCLGFTEEHKIIGWEVIKAENFEIEKEKGYDFQMELWTNNKSVGNYIAYIKTQKDQEFWTEIKYLFKVDKNSREFKIITNPQILKKFKFSNPKFNG